MQDFRSIFERYGHWIPTAALLMGLFWDSLTLHRPDNFFENAVVVGYLTLTAGIIVILNARRGRVQSDPIFLRTLLQFAFGNLTSALLILYARSGVIGASLLFFGALGVLLIGNELLRDRYARTHVHLIVWFVLVLIYSTLVVPIVLGTISTTAFLLGVVIACLLMALLILIIQAVAAHALKERGYTLVISGILVAGAFIGMYFTNNIPPVPLAAKHVGIYHDVTRIGDSYRVTFEKSAWYLPWKEVSSIYTLDRGGVGFCFTAIFAPARITTPVIHSWERKDATGWKQIARIPFTISGGREEGFRGYTQTSRLTPGTWRCRVETERGTVIGQTIFTVISGDVETLTERDL